MNLYPYQSKAVDNIRTSYKKGFRAPLFTLATGGGKTFIFSYIAKNASLKQKNILVLVHRVELLRQTSKSLHKLGCSHGLINPNYTPNPSELVQVASVQTVVRRLHKITAPDLIIIDEAHHSSAGSWKKIIDYYPDAKILGVTATPCRGDGRGLSEMFDNLILGPQTPELIDMGFLVQPKVYAPKNKLDLSGIRTKMGDYDKQEIADLMDKPTITGDAVDHYTKLCPGVPAVAFCVSIKHAKHVAEQFRRSGYKAYAVDGTMDDTERTELLDGLGNGTVDVITSCDLISEGTDIPAIGCAINLRPTQSLGLAIQQWGRALRCVYADGYDLTTTEGRLAAIKNGPKPYGIILDHVGNVLNHGMPDDFREWTLEGKKRNKRKTNQERDILVSQCDECFAVFKPQPVCPECGAVQKTKERELEQVDGELEEIKRQREKYEKKVEVWEAGSYEALKEIGKKRGYKPGWAKYRWENRKLN